MKNLLYFLIFLSFVIAGCTDNNPATAPIGSGLLVLTALGAGYAIS